MKKVDASGGSSNLRSSSGLSSRGNQKVDANYAINSPRLASVALTELDLVGGGRAIGYQMMEELKWTPKSRQKS